MKQENQHIDKLFRDRLGNYSETPPASVWDNLEKKLEGSGHNPGRRPLLRFWPLISLLFMISAVTAYFVYETSSSRKKDITSAIKPGTGAANHSADSHAASGYSDNTAYRNAENAITVNATDHAARPVADPSAAPSGLPDKNDPAGNPGPAALSRQTLLPGDNTGSKIKEQEITKRGDHDQRRSGNYRGATHEAVQDSNDIIYSPKTEENENNPERKQAGLSLYGKDNSPAESGKKAENGIEVSGAARSRPNNNHDDGVKDGYGKTGSNKDTGGSRSRISASGQDAGAPTGDTGNEDRVHNPSAENRTGNKEQGSISGNTRQSNSATAAGTGALNGKTGNRDTDNTAKSEKNGNGSAADQPPLNKQQTGSKGSSTEATRDTGNRAVKAPAPHAGIQIEQEDKNPENSKTEEAGNGGDTMHEGPGSREKTAPFPSSKKKLLFSGGVTLGYERGWNAFTSEKVTPAVYLQYNLSKRVGIMIQPAVKFANTNKSPSTSQDFYDILSSTHTLLVHKDSNNIPPDTSTKYIHTYRQEYDSLRISNSYGGRYMEVDIPLMATIKADKNLSFMGGVNFGFGKILRVTEERTTVGSYTLQYRDTTRSAAPEPFETVFPHAGQPVSSYNPGNNRNTSGNPMRFGYILGACYTVKNRLLIDVAVQQTISGVSAIPNENIRRIYTQPYLRFSIGYRLFGPRKEPE